MTVREALSRAKENLANSETPYLDALVLAAASLGVSKDKILAMYPEPFPDGNLKTYLAMLERRGQGDPVAYITGSKEFWGMNFAVGPGVLIPRPDTETIVEQALEYAGDKDTFDGTILDLCTGSGCIACALAKELPAARIYASDISEKALEYARKNIADLALPVTLLSSDLYQRTEGRFDMIVTNPPYVTEDEYRHLQLEVKKEPISALVSGEDGLDIIRRIISEGFERITTGGYLCIEASPPQADEIGACMTERGFAGITYTKDLAGNVRVISGRRP